MLQETSPVHGGRFDHIGVVVKSIAKAQQSMARTQGVREWTRPVRDEVNGVDVIFGRDAQGMVYELVAPLDETSPVFGALRERKNLLNHVAYLVDDLAQSGALMMAAGGAPTSEPKPAIAYGGRKIQLFVTPLYLVVELIEAPDHRHVFS